MTAPDPQPIAEKDAPAEREHRDGCMTEYTWDEDDCNCRPADCPICGGPVRSDGHCRWAPKGHVAPPPEKGQADV